MENRMERIFECELRALNNEQNGDFIEGRPIVFNSITNIGGWFNEVIDAQALDNADLRDVRFLVNHNTAMIPLARSRRNNVNSTMQMQVVPEGLDIRVNLDTENNTESRSLYSAVGRGDVTGMSFMFEIAGEEWEGLDTEMPTRRITEIKKVYEVSAVTFPAYEDTSINARDAEVLDSAKATLESVKRAEELKKAKAAFKAAKEDTWK
ncbi:MAG: HK97 family phage prohead protease [Bacteroidaceae bacterium]|nr:HK97 family phage prohead protease [Bacteroidaceae bacterium]